MVNRFTNNGAKKLAFTLMPGHCILCQSPSMRELDLCLICEKNLPWLGSSCIRCALPLAENHPRAQCGKCLRKPPTFDRCITPFRYDFPINQLIAGFKHQKKLHYGAVLAELWLRHCQSQLDAKPDLLIPVPIHWRRRLFRGFNQSLLLSTDLGKALDIPILSAVSHPRATHSQQGLSAAARRKNLQRAFSFSAGVDIKGRHLAIVDDVVTTTATANTMAAILARNGAARIDIWCLARTP